MKRAISLLLCLMLLVGTVAIGIDSPLFTIEAAAGNDFASAVSPTGPVPPGYANAKDPYNLMGTTNTKMVSAQHELLYSLSTANDSSDFGYRLCDNLKEEKIDGSTDAMNLNDTTYWDSATGEAYTVGGIYFMRSAALDSDGDGARESVVYIGWRQDSNYGKVVAWVFNSKTKQKSATVDLCGTSKGVYQLYKKDGSWREEATYQSLNFFSLAVGDWNGDGKETVFAAVPKGEDSWKKEVPSLVHITVSGNTISKSDPGYTAYMNQKFMNYRINESGDYEDLLSTQLASGDFNGDGKDDLAVLTYTNNITSSGLYNYDDEKQKDLYTPFLAVGYGSGSGIGADPSCSYWIDQYNKTNDDEVYYDIPIAGGILGADIDNDGREEIVIAGYYGQTINDNGKWRMLDSARNGNYMIYVTYNQDGGATSLSRRSFEVQESNGWTKGNSQSGVWLGTLATDDWCWQPVGLGAAAIDGPGQKKYVFINGTVFLYNTTNNSFSKQNTPDYFNKSDAGSNSWLVSVPFICGVANGTFDGSRASEEQFAVAVGLHRSSTTQYRYVLAVIGKKDTDNGRQFYCNRVDYGTDIGSGGNYSAGINAVDCDNDMFKVRFARKEYAWSDPDVVAVLQAAPYFGELGDNEGSTSISFTTSYESEYAHSATQALGVGASIGLDAEVVEVELKGGYDGEWSQTTFDVNGNSEEFGISVDEDSVVIKRAAAYYFGYDVWDAANNKWIPDGFHVDVIKDPQYYTFTVDQYNEYVDIYNQQMTSTYGSNYSKKLKKITEQNAPYLFGNEGNPFAYSPGPVGSKTADLGHNGGSQSISYSNYHGSGNTSSESTGYTFEYSAAGGVIGKVGVYGSYSYSCGYEVTQTVMNETATGGEVANLNDAAIAEETGSPVSLVNQYNFTWSFGEWGLNLVGNEDVKVYGYGLENITVPPPRVTDLSYDITNGGTELAFTWSEPITGGDTEIAGYYLYKSVEGGEFVKVSDELITGTEYTVTPEQYDRTKNTVFAVTSVVENTTSVGYTYTMEGLFSNQCRFNGDLNGRSAYEIACDEGFEGTVEEWLESLKGPSVKNVEKTASNGLVDTYTITFSDDTTAFFNVTNGADGLSAYEVAVSNGYQGTVEQWLALIGADCAQGHTYTEFTLPAGCGTPGCTVKVCSKCGASEFSMTDALEHNYTATEVPATHTMCGYTRYVCENCGDTYCDNLTPVTEHTYTENVVDPTCIESGYTEKTCTECGIVIRTDIIPPQGHSYSETVTEPTCSHYGYTTYKCDHCDSEYVSDITPTIDHSFTEKVVSNSCTTPGYTIKYCADCGFSVIENEVEAKGHHFEVSKVFDPTCSTKGYSIYTCTDCGVNFIDDETACTAHVPGEWVCEDPATGKYTQRCENCYKLLDTKTVSIVSGDGDSGKENPLNPNIDENGVLNIGYKESEKITLKVDGLDSSTVVYTSSDTKVATVDEKGNITAVGPGEAVVTASVPGTAIQTQVPVSVKLTWWQKVHYLLDSSTFFRALFMLFKIVIPDIFYK